MSEHVDAWTGTLAPESRHIVASGLSGTTSRAAVLISRVHFCGVHVRARLLRPARAKGFCPLGFLRRLASPALPWVGRRDAKGKCDDGIDLVRRSRRAAEETLGVRAFGQPDRRGTWKRDAKCGDRQGSPARSFR